MPRPFSLASIAAALGFTPVQVQTRQAIQAASVDGQGYPNFLQGGYGADVTYPVYAISGGDAGGGRFVAFDSQTGAEWNSSQTSTAVSGAAWIGQDFGTGNEKQIRRVTFTTSATAAWNISSVKIQYSSNAVTWTDVPSSPFTIATTASTLVSIDLAATGSYRFWRILANANPSGSTAWALQEIDMFEQYTSDLSINLAATTTPFVGSIAAGANSWGSLDYTYKITQDVTGAWSALPASSTCYLYQEYNPTTGLVSYGYSAAAAPVYAYTAPRVVSALDPVMTSNTTPSPYVVAASTQLASNEAYRAFNGDYGAVSNNGWLTSLNTTTGWLSIDMGSAISLNGYSINAFTAAAAADLNRMPKNWTFEGSNDNSAWTVLDSQGAISWTAGQIRTFTFLTIQTYRYWRINISANNGDASYCSVPELNLLGLVNGQHWFSIPAMQMYNWNGSAWTPVNRLFVGEAVTGASAVTSVVSYQVQDRWDSGYFPVAANTSYTKYHNIGKSLSHFDITWVWSSTGDDSSYLPAHDWYWNGSAGAGHRMALTTSTRNALVFGFLQSVQDGSTGGYYRTTLSRKW